MSNYYCEKHIQEGFEHAQELNSIFADKFNSIVFTLVQDYVFSIDNLSPPAICTICNTRENLYFVDLARYK